MSKQGNSLLSRASRVLSSPTQTPSRPTYWHDSTHRQMLVELWEVIVDLTAKNPKRFGGSSTSIRLANTQQQMWRKYPKLREGDVPLNYAWMEYVLGTALKAPFCTAETMGRWEVLSGSGGARGNWGPW